MSEEPAERERPAEREVAEADLAPSDLLLAARQVTRGTSALGTVLVCLGVFAVLAPLFSGIATTVLLGLLLIGGGGVETIYAFKAPTFGKGAPRLLFGGLSVVVGGLLLWKPGEGLDALTIALAAFFVAGGIIDVVYGFKLKRQEGWGWTLASGAVSVLLGAFIFWQWPVSGVWAVGIYVGVRLLMHGWMLMALGSAGRDAMAYLQNRRLEKLEVHLRAGLSALEETQMALAGVTATLVAVEAEQKDKVSAEDVDPAIGQLNSLLGEARAKMERAAAATAEAWDSAQRDANEKFEALQRLATEVVARLREERGLDKV